MRRRGFLARSLALGCLAAASPLITPVAFAQAPWENRLIVVILRGAMDGLDVVRPVGDPDFAALRRATLGREPGLPLDGFFEMHPALGRLMPLWRAGDLGFVHAVSTPYRSGRSHFDGQDLLEAGSTEAGAARGGVRGGWLNRMLQAVPGITGETTYAIGRSQSLLTDGPAPVSSWSPEAQLRLSPQAERLLELVHHDDPIFREASTEAIRLAALMADSAEAVEEGDAMMGELAGVGGAHVELARFAADRLREEARIATFSLNGWDTHANQSRGIARSLRALTDVILTLQARLGPDWDRTALVAMTEFGRTARENGSEGTDHGTGGAMVLAGGAIDGGRVLGGWPGLSEADLYEGRDLMPTRDLRAHAAWLMAGLFGLDRATLEGAVFPGLGMGADPGLLL